MLFKDITLIGADWQAHAHQNLLVEGDVITYIGKDLPPDYTGPIYSGQNKMAVPGFYNAHCHAPMGLMRGYGEGLALDRWLNEKIFPFEALLTDKDVYWGTLLGISEMLAGGVCSFTDMYMDMPNMIKAVEESGIKANLSHGTTCFDGGNFASTNGFRGLQQLLEHTAGKTTGRILADASIHGEYTSHPSLVAEIARFAKEHRLGIHLHLSETQQEHEACKERHGKTPAAYFESLGVFESPVLAAHCVWIEEADFDILAQNGATVSYNPSSNLKLGSGIAPVKMMLEKWVQVAFGTDGASSNNNLNLLEEIHLGALLQKGVNQQADFLTTGQLLQMATQNGALAQRRANCGFLAVGNHADISVFNLDRPHMQPIYDAAASLLFSAQASDCCLTMVDGQILYQDGEYKTIDMERVLHEARTIRDDKLSRLG